MTALFQARCNSPQRPGRPRDPRGAGVVAPKAFTGGFALVLLGFAWVWGAPTAAAQAGVLVYEQREDQVWVVCADVCEGPRAIVWPLAVSQQLVEAHKDLPKVRALLQDTEAKALVLQEQVERDKQRRALLEREVTALTSDRDAAVADANTQRTKAAELKAAVPSTRLRWFLAGAAATAIALGGGLLLGLSL